MATLLPSVFCLRIPTKGINKMPAKKVAAKRPDPGHSHISKYLIFCAIAVPLITLLFFLDKTKTTPKASPGPQDKNVFQRGLVEREPLVRDILIHSGSYFKETGLKNFDGAVLGYVTVWNPHGYDVAKIFAKKFQLISPVWFQVVKNGEAYEIAGTHDIDYKWVSDVREASGGVTKIFPRIIFDKFTQRDYSRMLSIESERTKVNELIVELCKKHHYDGIVLEFWLQLGSHVDHEILNTLVLDMVKALKKHDLRLILVIPPFGGQIPDMFNEKNLNKLYKDVYAFSLMTYDFSLAQMRAAVEHIAPKNTIDVKTKRRKILMGLNMYGNDFTSKGGSPIVAGQYLDFLKHAKQRLSFDENKVENFFDVRTETGSHTVSYPSLYSLNERIKLAKELGVGLSIWELGQGLDFFYDLF